MSFTREIQFKLQNFYLKFESIWKKVFLPQKTIIWINPYYGFAVAAYKNVETQVTLPNVLPTFQENLDIFNSLWLDLDYKFESLIENIKIHKENQEYCCLDCCFPFATICAELYTKFDPD